MTDLIKILSEIAEDAENVRDRCYDAIRQLQNGSDRRITRKPKSDAAEKRRIQRLKQCAR